MLRFVVFLRIIILILLYCKYLRVVFIIKKLYFIIFNKFKNIVNYLLLFEDYKKCFVIGERS